MLLYRTVIPQNESEAVSLYFRADGGMALHNGMIELQPGAVVSFNTYFNGFFYSKYLKYTSVGDLTAKIEASGRLNVELVCSGKDLVETVIESKEIKNSDVALGPVALDTLPEGGMIFCRFRAVEKSLIRSVSYETSTDATRPIMLAAVICTYHREEYVRHTLDRLNKSIWNGPSPITDELDAIVIDNGNSLGKYDNYHVRIVPNRNLGGSGGFARGMIEALDRGDKYTHVLLMDDDISFEPEVLVRTVQLLKVLKEFDEPIFVGGQMLIEDTPTIQYEAGGRYVKGRLNANCRHVELGDLTALLANEQERPIDYNAWWYCCMPTSAIRGAGLPLPLFIKEDDVEYGLRVKPRFLITNGIGVWHQAFSNKRSPYLEYYIKRNELIVSALYGIGGGVIQSMIKLFRGLGGSLIRKETARIRYLKMGYEDFLRGPEFFADINAEELNSILLSMNDKAPPGLIAIFTCIGVLLKFAWRFAFEYKRVRNAYLDKHRELTSMSFWKNQLSIIACEEGEKAGKNF